MLSGWNGSHSMQSWKEIWQFVVEGYQICSVHWTFYFCHGRTTLHRKWTWNSMCIVHQLSNINKDAEYIKTQNLSSDPDASFIWSYRGKAVKNALSSSCISFITSNYSFFTKTCCLNGFDWNTMIFLSVAFGDDNGV